MVITSRSSMSRVFSYIVIVLLLSWSITLFAFSDPSRNGLYATIMLVPALVSIPFARREGEPRFAIFRTVPSPRSLLFAIIYPVLVIVLCAIISSAVGWAVLNPSNFSPFRAELLSPTLIFGFLLTWGEEQGWRGYLLPRVSQRFGRVGGTLVVGVVWALFHGPTLYFSARTLGTGTPWLVALIQMGSVLVISFPFSYAYYLSGSVLPCMVFHFIWNVINPPVLGNLYRNLPGMLQGNILLINGEGLLGMVVGLLILPWFVRQFKALDGSSGKSSTAA